MSDISVIICTYNPNPEIFVQCLDALSKALVVGSAEEIIIIDNNSTIPLKDQVYVKHFIACHKQARIVKEEQQGLTPARLRGIKEATGSLLVFIDDDNFIKEDFFLKGMEIEERYKHIGAFSGQVKLLFETTPQEWTRKYWGLLVYREFKGNFWSNFPNMPETMPCGAGLFVRKNVAEYYNQLHVSGKRSVQLDRTANSLFSAGDNDLAACACDIGLGVGIFDELILNHYIPAKRLTREYLLKLAEGIEASSIVFRSFRGEYPGVLSIKNRSANLLRLLFKSSIDRSFFKAVLKGNRAGRKMIGG